MTGRGLALSLARSWRRIVNPLMSGSMRSRISTSGVFCASQSSASLPEKTACTSKPACARTTRMTDAKSWLSSTTRMRGLASGDIFVRPVAVDEEVPEQQHADAAHERDVPGEVERHARNAGGGDQPSGEEERRAEDRDADDQPGDAHGDEFCDLLGLIRSPRFGVNPQIVPDEVADDGEAEREGLFDDFGVVAEESGECRERRGHEMRRHPRADAQS